MTPEPGATSGASPVERLLRELAPEVLGAVARRHRDFAAAEDAVQEALIAAAEQWPREGIPRNPRGWLYHVAVRRLTDHLRSEVARIRREKTVAGEVWAQWEFVPPPDAEVGVERDDSLVLLFMCAHPALTPASAIALTLRAVGGLTTAEIASAFLVPEATMAQRISRAKQSIKASNVPFRMPDPSERASRLASVQHVLYLIFNEGYTSTSGSELHRPDLSNEAIRLARALHVLMPDDAEVAGLLALMLLTDARRAARTGSSGELIPLDEQDRTKWDRRLVSEGVALVEAALKRGPVGPFQLQAAIAAVHDEAERVEETDWPQILALYRVLEGMSDNPMVSLNRAIAVAMVEGPAAGLQELELLDGDARIAGHYRLDAVRGHLFERSGDRERAVAHYRAAAARTTSMPERDYLIMKASTAMTDSYTIRDATPGDIATLVTLTLREALEAEGLDLDETAVRRGVAAAFEDPPLATYWVVERDGRIAGSVSAVKEWSNFHGGHYWWVQSMFIVPEHRGRGLIDRLIDHVARRAQAAGALDLRLYAHASNERALRAYRRCGFDRAPYVMMTKGL
ncbi:MAG TPA: GNAT family N-acetyltransferase [Gemmatimonadaceae bacterium]|nr:GNAT family N-acetyltransferase [Gemmatimonadaceae bacterium]